RDLERLAISSEIVMTESDARAVLVRLDHVEPRPIAWLWPRRIPRGKITILDGDPDVGKSTLTLDLAARVTTGALMPDGSPGTLGGVVLLSAEDDASDTIVPRLQAADADLGRIHLLEAVRCEGRDPLPPVLPANVNELEAAIVKTDAALVIVDPLM